MKHQVYYGEYSLNHWIELILKKNIVLPPYQRYFVWDEEEVRRLLLSLKDRQFIPPVIIGAFEDETKKQNLILDGQQRLTSILLAALGVFPEKSKFNTTITNFFNENDDSDATEETREISCEWTFNHLVNKVQSLRSIKDSIDASLYKEVNFNVGGTFFDDTYLGFCYLIPSNDDRRAQQRYYSTLFRNINFQGQELSAQESREALYFLDSEKTSFFKPDFISTINQRSSKGMTNVDFVRFLSLISEYKKSNDFNKVAIRTGRKMEAYYEDYIYSVANDDDSPKYGKCSLMIPKDHLQQRLDTLKSAVEQLGYTSNTYTSIIHLDIDFFGLIYYVLFEGKSLQEDKIPELKNKLRIQTERYRKDKNHSKTPSALKHLRNRMRESIKIYRKYML